MKKILACKLFLRLTRSIHASKNSRITTNRNEGVFAASSCQPFHFAFALIFVRVDDVLGPKLLAFTQYLFARVIAQA
jgi:hypothetical protein